MYLERVRQGVYNLFQGYMCRRGCVQGYINLERVSPGVYVKERVCPGYIYLERLSPCVYIPGEDIP